MRKIVIQNLIITIASKAFGFLSFLYIAKVLTTHNYGIYVYVALIISLLPLLQFGSSHGLMILLPKFKANRKKNPFELFVVDNYISHIIQLLSIALLFILNIPLEQSIIGIIAINFFLSLYIQNTIIYLNSLHNFQTSNIVKSFEQVFKPIIILTFFYFHETLFSIFFAQLIATSISFILSLYLVPFKFIVFKKLKIKAYLSLIYKVGFFVYLSWAIDIVFRTADKWFISQFYSTSELALYGFSSSLSLNIWLIAMSFFTPFTQILYKHIAENNYISALNTIESTNKKLYLLLIPISILSIILYPLLLEYIINKYYGSESLFITLVISSVLLSINNMYIYYMISNNQYKILLRYQIIILCINLILNTFFVYLHLPIIFYSFATILSLFIYFTLVRRYFYIDIQKKIQENI